LKPDVLTLDIEMPRMDGLTFLKILMKHHPMPIIIFSSLTQAGSQIAIQALQLGAIDVLGKPSGSYSVGEMGIHLVEKVKAAARARMGNLPPPEPSAIASAPAPSAHPAPAAAAPRPAFAAAPAPKFHPRQLVLL